jgi:hypothetical protein
VFKTWLKICKVCQLDLNLKACPLNLSFTQLLHNRPFIIMKICPFRTMRIPRGQRSTSHISLSRKLQVLSFWAKISLPSAEWLVKKGARVAALKGVRVLWVCQVLLWCLAARVAESAGTSEVKAGKKDSKIFRQKGIYRNLKTIPLCLSRMWEYLPLLIWQKLS